MRLAPRLGGVAARQQPVEQGRAPHRPQTHPAVGVGRGIFRFVAHEEEYPLGHGLSSYPGATMSAPNQYNQSIIEQFRANGGKTDYSGPLVLITTTGAKIGSTRTTPVAFARDGDQLVIIASAGGAPTHPDRYFNLVAIHIVTVELGTETFRARATVV